MSTPCTRWTAYGCWRRCSTRPRCACSTISGLSLSGTPPRSLARTRVSRGARDWLRLLPRIAGVVGAEDALAGFSAVADWRRPELAPPKDRDFALALGPVVVTRDELDPDGLEAVVRVDAEERLRGRVVGFDWEAARAHAVDGTMLRPGDLLVGPPLDPVDELAAGNVVELEVSGIGSLSQSLTA